MRFIVSDNYSFGCITILRFVCSSFDERNQTLIVQTFRKSVWNEQRRLELINMNESECRQSRFDFKYVCLVSLSLYPVDGGGEDDLLSFHELIWKWNIVNCLTCSPFGYQLTFDVVCWRKFFCRFHFNPWYVFGVSLSLCCCLHPNRLWFFQRTKATEAKRKTLFSVAGRQWLTKSISICEQHEPCVWDDISKCPVECA